MINNPERVDKKSMINNPERVDKKYLINNPERVDKKYLNISGLNSYTLNFKKYIGVWILA